MDVRSLPGSRRYPHFNQETMPTWLAVPYVHLPALGGHRKACADGGFETVRNSGFRGYAQYTQSREFAEGIEALLSIEEPAIMCAEAVWWRCHRRLIAEYLTEGGVKVRHIMPDGRLAVPEVDLLSGVAR